MKKRFLALLILIFISGCGEVNKNYCEKDSDCVLAACCHPNSCININYKPDCNDIMCTAVCMPCYECRCINSECKSELVDKNGCC